MESKTGAAKARRNGRAYHGLIECRHMLESCSHKIRSSAACGRYAVSGGRLGHLAWSLM